LSRSFVWSNLNKVVLDYHTNCITYSIFTFSTFKTNCRGDLWLLCVKGDFCSVSSQSVTLVCVSIGTQCWTREIRCAWCPNK
jgi:hypothetical protein